MSKLISREEAVEVLYDLINSSILSNELEDDLRDIANVISHERAGFHFWGADADEYTKFVTSVRADLMTGEYLNECEKIRTKYSFKPSPVEQEIINKEKKEALTESEISDVEILSELK